MANTRMSVYFVVSAPIYVYIYIYLRMSTYYTHVYACVYSCTNSRMFVCICVCTHIYTLARAVKTIKPCNLPYTPRLYLRGRSKHNNICTQSHDTHMPCLL